VIGTSSLKKKKVAADNSTSKLIYKVTETMKWWVARRDVCPKSFPKHAWSHIWPVWNIQHAFTSL